MVKVTFLLVFFYLLFWKKIHLEITWLRVRRTIFFSLGLVLTAYCFVLNWRLERCGAVFIQLKRFNCSFLVFSATQSISLEHTRNSLVIWMRCVLKALESSQLSTYTRTAVLRISTVSVFTHTLYSAPMYMYCYVLTYNYLLLRE